MLLSLQQTLYIYIDQGSISAECFFTSSSKNPEGKNRNQCLLMLASKFKNYNYYLAWKKLERVIISTLKNTTGI